MNEVHAATIAALLADAARIADEAASSVEAADEALSEFRHRRDEIERAMFRCSVRADGPALAEAAEAVWRCAGAVLVLDLDDAEFNADRMEVLGDQIVRLRPGTMTPLT